MFKWFWTFFSFVAPDTVIPSPRKGTEYGVYEEDVLLALVPVDTFIIFLYEILAFFFFLKYLSVREKLKIFMSLPWIHYTTSVDHKTEWTISM